MRNGGRSTSLVSASIAIVIGAAFAGIASAFALAQLSLLDSDHGTWRASREGMIDTGVLMSLGYAGAMLLSSPVWFWLHKRGQVRWFSAALFGLLATLIPFEVLQFAAGIRDVEAQWVPLALAAISTATGLVVWRVAYRRKP